MSESPLNTRTRLGQVRYEIRGELARRARELEAQGRELIKLHIGNPAAFGLHAPGHVRAAVANGIANSDAYGHQQGLLPAREAIVAQFAGRGVAVDPSAVFIGNGVSELIDIALRALLDPGDEVLLPSPDYPLWSAATLLNDGTPIYYRCPPDRGFLPDPEQIAALITPRTRALVIINPNNPTGAVYPRPLLEALVELAREHGLLLLSDEIYDGIVYDGACFQPLAPIAGEVPCLSLCGLSKVYRACGYRVGWAVLSGDRRRLAAYHHALDLLGALRLCANMPGQWAIPAALTGPDTMTSLCAPGGRLYAARQEVIEGCARSRWLRLNAPAGALYGFPAVVGDAAIGFDDHQFAIELLERESVLIVPGSSFNVPYRNHFRVTLLPEPAQIAEVFARIDRVLARRAGTPATKAHGVRVAAANA